VSQDKDPPLDMLKGMARAPFYKTTRGEWYVIWQVLLMSTVLFGSRGEGGWRFPPTMFSTGAGILLILAGIVMLLAAKSNLGSNLTPLPHPKDNATLVTTGLYQFVRHPMYSGGILFAVGWTLVVHSWMTLIYAVILLIFIDIKSRREERWLVEKFPEYSDYQKQVRKLIPYIY
jgi:protein-S-isoprenylcysteine O-methyltransferase Ste14